MLSMCRITSSRHCCRRRSSTAIESASRTEPTRLRARVPIVRKRPNRGTRRFARAAAAVMLLDSRGGSCREDSMNYQHIRVMPASAYVGAEIGGVDLAKPLKDEALGEIRRAFGEYGVVFFRDQRLSPEQHIAVAERFGPIDINRFFAHVPGYPITAEVRKEPEQQRNIGAAGTPTTATTRCRLWVRCSMPARCRKRAATRCLPACTPRTTRCPMA